MKKFLSGLMIACALSGLAGAMPDERDVKAERGEVLAISELDRRRAELRQALQALDADANSLIAEIASHHALAAGETITSFDPKTSTFHVASVGSVAAVASR